MSNNPTHKLFTLIGMALALAYLILRGLYPHVLATMIVNGLGASALICGALAQHYGKQDRVEVRRDRLPPELARRYRTIMALSGASIVLVVLSIVVATAILWMNEDMTGGVRWIYVGALAMLCGAGLLGALMRRPYEALARTQAG